LWKRDPFDLAAELRRELVHTNANQAGTLTQRPSVPGVIAKLFGNLESTDEAGRQVRRCLVLGRFNYRLNDNLSAVKMIDQQKRHACEKNQQDCHTSPRRKGRRFVSLCVSCPLAALLKGNQCATSHGIWVEEIQILIAD
jgi:hypothetical protein